LENFLAPKALPASQYHRFLPGFTFADPGGLAGTNCSALVRQWVWVLMVLVGLADLVAVPSRLRSALMRFHSLTFSFPTLAQLLLSSDFLGYLDLS
jgi:hypothetical protein